MTYSNVPTLYKGILYPSKTEAQYAEYLDKLKAKGKIKWWKRQVTFEVEGADGVKHRVIADFLVMPSTREEIHETKFNLITDKFIYKSQLFLEQYPNILYYVLEPDGNYGWKRTPLAEFIKPYLQAQAAPTKQYTKTQIFLSKCFYTLVSKIV